MPHRSPTTAVERLIAYYRYMQQFAGEGQAYVLSEQIAQQTGASSAQVRKDLSAYGSLGTRGKGYQVATLLGTLTEVLHKQQPRLVALVGVGHLGLALLRHADFRTHGFHIVAGFDRDLAKVGHSIDGVYVYDVSQIERVCPELGVEIGLITVPAAEAQQVADLLVRGGVLAILNFALRRLCVPEHIHLRRVDLSLELEKLNCCLSY